jgi:AraC-like DNA-binding protein
LKIISTLLNTFKIRLVSVNASRVGNWWNYKNLNSPYSRLYLITKGLGYIEYNDIKYELTPGNLHLVPRFTFHSISCPNQMEHYYLHFVCELANGMDIFKINSFEYQLPAPENTLKLFRRLIDMNPHREMEDFKHKYKKYYDPIYESKIQFEPNEKMANMVESEGIMKLLVAPFLRTQRECVTKMDKYDDGFMKVFEYIHNNINRRLELHELAKLVYLNPTYFSNRFEKMVGIRPTKYITRCRLEKAQVLMMDFSKSLSEIAYQTGFNDLPHFSKTFTNSFGIGPAAYRKELQNH